MANEFKIKHGFISTGSGSVEGELRITGASYADNGSRIATRPWVTQYLSDNSYATAGDITTAISNLVDSAPGTLDTLNELAAAIGDDPNFATSISTSIAAKLPLTGGTMTGNITFTDNAEGIVWSRNTDGASIKFYNTADGDTDSRLEFHTNDNNNEYFRWTHGPSGGALYEVMKLMPTSSGSSRLTVSGDIYSGSNKMATETHVSANYLSKFHDMTITLTGDASGTGTFNNMGDVSFAVTVANDSHTHDGRYYTETEIDTFLGDKAPKAHTHDAADIVSGTFPSERLSGTYTINVSGTSTYANNLYRDDNRTIAPSEDTNGTLSFGFTSFQNDNTGPWADYLHLRSYTDSSGGRDNLLMFSKSDMEIRLWQQDFNSSDNYADFRDVAFKDELQVPAIKSNGSTPSLNTGISAGEIRTLIGAGTSSFDGAYSSLTGLPTLGTAAASASTDFVAVSGDTMSGNLIMQSADPTIKFSIYGAENNAGIVWEDGDAGDPSSQAAAIKWSASDNIMRFYNNDEAAERMRIAADGTVTFANGIVTSGGISGLTLSNGISGTNFNITGVNELSIADPGEGIVWTNGASGNISLATVDDSSDNILRLSGTGATLQVGTNTVYHEGNLHIGTLDGYTQGEVDNLVDGRLALTGGTLTGQVIFPSATTTKPVLPNGFISRNDLDDTTGRHDIWGISEKYYPSNATAGDAWGIQWSGTPNDIVFVGGGQDKVTISLDEGNITTLGTLSASGYNKSNWDTAYGWGNHADFNYLTSVPATFSATQITLGSGVVLRESSDRSDLLSISSSTSSWGGLQVTNSSNEALGSFMVNDSSIGLYDDQQGEWIMLYSENAGIQFFNNGDAKLTTNGSGANVIGRVYATTGLRVDYVVGSHVPLVALHGAETYGLFHTEATNDEFTFDFNGTQMYKFRQDGVFTLNGNTITTGKITNWDTAYSWGNHASAGYLTSLPSHNHDTLYDSLGSANAVGTALNERIDTEVFDAIGNVAGSIPTNNNQLTNGAGYITSADGGNAATLDGIDSTGFVKQLSDTSNPNYQTPSSRRVDPNATNPTNAHYAITTFGNGGNVTGQLATHFQTGKLYSRGYNSSWSAWNAYATEAYVNTAVSNLVDSAPGALNTLNELAAALGDDANFSTTVANNIGAIDTRINDEVIPYIDSVAGDAAKGVTAYGWGDHAGLYLGATAKAADSNLLDGINSTSFLRSDQADTMSGTLTITGSNGVSRLRIEGTTPTIDLDDSDGDSFYIHVNSNNFYVLTDRDGGGDYGEWDGAHPMQLEADTNSAYFFGNKLNSAAYAATTAFDSAGSASTAQANAIAHADDRIDSEVLPQIQTPAITSNGTVPALNSGISAAEVRSLIGAGTSSSDTNYYLSGASFNTSDGVLTLTVSGAANQGVDLDGRYLPLSGGSVSGNIIMTNTNPMISFVPSGTNDAAGIRFNYTNNDGVMEFWTSDDYSEPFVWRAYDIGLVGTGTYQEWMRLQGGTLTLSGNIVANQADIQSITSDGSIANDKGSYLHIGGWGVSRTHSTAVLVNTAYRTDILSTSRNFTIGNTTRSFNGSANVSWTLAEIGAEAAGAAAAVDQRIEEEVLPAIPTDNSQLTNGAGYITSADGGNAQTLDGLDSSAFVRKGVGYMWTATGSNALSFRSQNTIESSSGDQAALEVFQDNAGEDAFMQFHVSSDYAVYFGLDGSTNDLAVGGWSMGANKYKIWHAGNDGSGSGLDADKLDGLHESTFMRRSANSNLVMNNYNITGVNHITINDSGFGEGIQWQNWLISDSPDDLSNGAGNLQISSTAAPEIRVTIDTNGNLYPSRDRQHFLGLETNRWQIVFCEILDSAGQHEKNLQNPEGEKSVGEYPTGTVLVWKGGKNIPCTEYADHMRMGVAVNGVASPLIQGAEPVLVTGSVKEGDYLITSRKEGHAEAISPELMRQQGLYDCVFGKALETADGESHLVKVWINI